MSGMFESGRIKLQICVNNDRGSKKIPRAMMEKWGQLCFGKLHSDSRSLPSLLYNSPRIEKKDKETLETLQPKN